MKALWNAVIVTKAASRVDRLAALGQAEPLATLTAAAVAGCGATQAIVPRRVIHVESLPL